MWLAACHGFEVFWVAVAFGGDAGGGFVDGLEVGWGQVDVEGSEVFFEAVEFGGAGDGGHPGLLGEDPGEGDLGWGGFLLGGDVVEEVDEGGVGLHGFGLEAGEVAAEIVGGEACVLVHGAGEEAFA